MPQVMPWYCPHTDTLFGSKIKYREHVKTMAALRYNVRKRKQLVRWAENEVLAARSCTTFQDLADWIEAHPRVVFYLSMRNDYYFKDETETYSFPTEPDFAIRFWDMRYMEMKDGPAFQGYVQYKFSTSDYGWFPHKDFGIQSGSGGGSYGYMKQLVWFSAEDWPALCTHESMKHDSETNITTVTGSNFDFDTRQYITEPSS